jgi:hypothetical protein
MPAGRFADARRGYDISVVFKLIVIDDGSRVDETSVALPAPPEAGSALDMAKYGAVIVSHVIPVPRHGVDGLILAFPVRQGS